MSFKIGSQTAAIINNVEGDQHVTGGQYAAVEVDAVAAIRALRAGLATAGLPAAVASAATQEADTLEAELSRENPNKARAATALERLTRLLVTVGPVSTAIAALSGPITSLAQWLGPLGESVLRLLQRM